MTDAAKADGGFRVTLERPDADRVPVSTRKATGIPQHDRETMQTNVPGLYVAGVLAAGDDANTIFIENGREHGVRIVASVIRD